MLDQFERIYALVREIPRGRVTTYGQLGAMCGIGDARIVGEAMNSSHSVPWQRVINSRGEVSIQGATGRRQRELLEQEGIEFDANGRIDLARFGWTPDAQWLKEHGYRPPPPLAKEKKPGGGDPAQDAGEQLTLF
jgi:methylated-DNA-protein-cysteine methyltransferase related protein